MYKHVKTIREKQFGLASLNINQTFTTRAKTQTTKIAKVKVPKHRELSVRSAFDSHKIRNVQKNTTMTVLNASEVGQDPPNPRLPHTWLRGDAPTRGRRCVLRRAVQCTTVRVFVTEYLRIYTIL